MALCQPILAVAHGRVCEYGMASMATSSTMPILYSACFSSDHGLVVVDLQGQGWGMLM
jgi:hypothetical protein